jgi:hypothetical protein
MRNIVAYVAAAACTAAMVTCVAVPLLLLLLLPLQVAGLLTRGEQHLWGGEDCDAARVLYRRLQEAQQWAAQVRSDLLCSL